MEINCFMTFSSLFLNGTFKLKSRNRLPRWHNGPGIRGHTLITLAHKGTLLVLISEQNPNLVNRSYLVNMLTRIWSKLDKNLLIHTRAEYKNF